MKETAEAEHHSGRSSKLIDAVVASGLFFLVCLYFFRTILFAQPISRVWYVACGDNLLKEFRALGGGPFDQALFWELIPNLYAVSNIWRSGNLPLWNPYSCAGAPLIGDAQMHVFSPWRLLFSCFHSLYFYNLEVVMTVAITFIATYFLARTLNLSRCASIFAVIGYAACPNILFNTEILSGTSQCLMPVTALMFARLGQKLSLGRAFMAGVAAAIFALSGNPESAFYAAAGGALLTLVLATLGREKEGRNLQTFWRAIGYIFLSAVVAVCLSAPFLFSFVEFLINSDAGETHRKVTASGMGLVKWQALFFNLIHPGFAEAAMYPGILAVPLFGLALLSEGQRKRTTLCLAVILVTTFLFLTQGGWDEIHIHALEVMNRRHAMPLWILSFALIASIGLDELLETFKLGINKRTFTFFSLAALTVFIPWSLHLFKLWDPSSAMFYSNIPTNAFQSRNWTYGLVVVLLTLIAVCLRRYIDKIPVKFLTQPTGRKTLLFAGFILILALVDQTYAAKGSLPVQPPFEFKVAEPLEFLKQNKGRVLQIGENVMAPSTNFVHEIASVRTENVMKVSRYTPFITAAGSGPTFSFDDGQVSPLMNLASIKYILTQIPIGSSIEKYSHSTLSKPIGFTDSNDIQLVEVRHKFRPRCRDVIGELRWRTTPDTAKNFVYVVSVTDLKGNPYWFGSQRRICPAQDLFSASGTSDFTTPLGGLVPKSVADGTPFLVRLQVFNLKQNKWLIPKTSKGSDSNIQLGQFTLASPDNRNSDTVSNDENFRLVGEYGNDCVRIYENLNALPEAYLVHKVIPASTGASALAAIQKPDFLPRQEVVVEGNSLSSISSEEGAAPNDRVVCTRPSPNLVNVKVACQKPGVLILTDTYYPGWHAYLDGKEVKIERANYLFRGVQIPAGEHTVEFRYLPSPFVLGVGLFLACLIVAALLSWKNFKDKKNHN
jgi:hypothetical protein